MVFANRLKKLCAIARGYGAECVSRRILPNCLLDKNLLSAHDVDTLRWFAQALACQIEDAVLNRLCCLNISNAVGIDVNISTIVKPYLLMVFEEHGIAVLGKRLIPNDVALVAIQFVADFTACQLFVRYQCGGICRFRYSTKGSSSLIIVVAVGDAIVLKSTGNLACAGVRYLADGQAVLDSVLDKCSYPANNAAQDATVDR